MLAQLVAFKAMPGHGHCDVAAPGMTQMLYPRLSRWVKMQRNNKKKLENGWERAGLTPERIAKLDAIGALFSRAGQSFSRAHRTEPPGLGGVCPGGHDGLSARDSKFSPFANPARFPNSVLRSRSRRRTCPSPI